MTNDIKRSQGKFDHLAETRDWSAASEDVFNFRLKPALDQDSDRWLLIQKCRQGIKSVKTIT